MRVTLILLMSAVLAFPAFAGSICYFPRARSSTLEDVFAAAAASVCIAEALPVPAGSWWVYTVGPAGVSDHAEEHDGGAVTRHLQVAPPAMVLVPSGAKVRHFYYVVDTGALFPMPSGESPVLVPAQRRILILQESSGVLMAVAEPLSLEPNERRVLNRFIQTDLLVASITSDGNERLDDLPRISATADNGRTYAPWYPLPRQLPPLALSVFTVPSSLALDVRATGRAWREASVAVPPVETGVRLAGPVSLSSRKPLVVEWQLPASTRALAKRMATSCATATESSDEPLDLDLLSCSGVSAGTSVADGAVGSCTRLDSSVLPPGKEDGVADFDGTPGATYVLRVSHAGRPLDHVVVTATGQRQFVPFLIDPEVYSGRVRLDGEPLRALLLFSRNPPLVSNDEGEYAGILARPPKGQPIVVRGCDQRVFYIHVPPSNHQPQPHIPYEIDIPLHELTINVADATDGRPLEGVDLMLNMFDNPDGKKMLAGTTAGKSDKEGRLTVTGVAADAFMAVMGRHDGYEIGSSEVFHYQGTQSVALALRRKGDSKRGRIEGTVSPLAGTVYWYTPDGRHLEEVTSADDGTFRYANDHPDPVIWFAGKTGPLARLRPIPAPGEDLVLRLATGPQVSVDIRLSPAAGEPYAFTIALAGTRVPWEVLSTHMLRLVHQQPLLAPGGKVRVGPVLADGPLEVLAIRNSSVSAARDFLAFAREFAMAPRLPVAAGEVLISP